MTTEMTTDQIVDITNKRFCILGLQGTGKSVLVKYFLKNTKACIVYDVQKEHYGFNRYIVSLKQVRKYEPDDPAIRELNRFIDRVVVGSGQIRLFIFEEANRYCPSKRPLPNSVLTLNDDQRHLKVGFGVIARRPTQLNTDLVELAHYLFIYRLPGKNDIEYLESIAEGLGETVRNLKDFHFVVVLPDRRYFVHEPVPFDEKRDTATGKDGTVIQAKDMTKV